MSRPHEIVVATGDREADSALAAEVMAFLQRHEAANAIQVSSLLAANSLPPSPNLLVTRTVSGITGVATWARPSKIVLASNTELEAIPAIVGAYRATGAPIPGVMGVPVLARAFALAWERATGVSAHVEMEQRLLGCVKVHEPASVDGSARPVTAADRDVILGWFAAFAIEAEHVSRSDARLAATRMLDRMGESATGLLWFDPHCTPASLAFAKAPTPHGIRIGPVYTPPEQRRRGFAGAVTAALTRQQLEAGRSFVCLYTDAANPTANHIYEQIGYECVTDSIVLAFECTETCDGR